MKVEAKRAREAKAERARAVAEALESIRAAKRRLEGLCPEDGNLPPATPLNLGSACSCLGLAAERLRDTKELFGKWGIYGDE